MAGAENYDIDSYYSGAYFYVDLEAFRVKVLQWLSWKRSL